MSENVVDVTKTPIDMRTYARALARAWRDALGELPTKAQAGVLWAQFGIETGAGPWCWNWNIGNVKHVAGDGHDYMMLAHTWEMEHGRKVIYEPPNPATWFRSFASLDAAMHEHFALLRGSRYAPAWAGVEAGDCTLFAQQLKAHRYFTATAESYAAGMLAHFAIWMRSSAFDDALEELAGETPSVVTSEQLLEEPATVHPELSWEAPEREPSDDV